MKVYKFTYKKFFLSIIFSYVLSVVAHFFIMTFLLYKFNCTENDICTKKSETAVFFLYKIDQFSHETLEKKRLFNTIIPIDKKKQLKNKFYHDKINNSLNNSKNLSHSFIDTKLSSSLIMQHDINHTKLAADTVLSASQNKKIVNCNDNISNITPNVVFRVHPIYPSRARVLGIEGELVVIFNVNNLGKVENIRIFSATPTGIFERSVRSAMRLWTYESNKAKQNLIIMFKFRLDALEIFDCQKNK